MAAALASIIGDFFPQLPERIVRNAVKVLFEVAHTFDKELFAAMRQAILDKGSPKPTVERSWDGYL